MDKIIARYYSAGIYTKDNVKTFVKAGWISAERYELITGEEYTV